MIPIFPFALLEFDFFSQECFSKSYNLLVPYLWFWWLCKCPKEPSSFWITFSIELTSQKKGSSQLSCTLETMRNLNKGVYSVSALL